MVSLPETKLMETKMKKFVIAIATLASISAGALANGNHVDADSTYPNIEVTAPAASDVNAFEAVGAVKGQTVYFGRYGTTKDALEARRWDEKN